jgi:lipopolysaccharide transport protein LptA
MWKELSVKSDPARTGLIQSWLSLVAAAVLLHLVMGNVWAKDAVKEKKTSKVHIVTDQAIVDTRARSTELSGNVTLTMDETGISADWIKMVYKAGIKNLSTAKMDEKTIDTITAKGNVKIKMEDMTAETREAIYQSSDNTLVLTGENTRISSGGDFITCDRVTINMEDQSFKAESFGKGPVEAVFHTKPENFNLKK